MTTQTRDTLNAFVEFDVPFRVHDDGAVTRVRDTGREYWAPECYHDDDNDIDMCGYEEHWHAETGWTGQDRYHGAVMHPSEYLGGRMAQWVLDTPGVYVVVVCDVLADDDTEDRPYGPEPAGWVLMSHVTND